MSQENVEIVRRGFAELGGYPERIEAAEFAKWFAPDVEVDLTSVYPDLPVVRGLDRWLGLVTSLPWGDSLNLEPERFFDVDDERVLVFMRVMAEGAESGVPVERHDAHEYTIRDGLCVRIKVYADRAEA